MPVSSVAIVSLGCPKNTADTDLLSARLKNAGLDVVDEPESADAVIVNTCGFIQAACEESLDTVMELAELKRRGRLQALFVCGCLSERYGEELKSELREADRLFGLVERDCDEIVAALTAARDVRAEGGRAVPSTPYAYVKISEGCDRSCSFCTIPWIRGAFRSRPAVEVEREVRRLVEGGVKEIVLVGQDTAAWGDDLPGRPRLAGLLEGLAGSFHAWFRLMYLQPDRVNDELIETVAAHENVCDYFDVPFQHASDAILGRMRRPGDAGAFLALLDGIRARLPDAAIRTTLIVGFPGESETDFERLADFVARARPDYTGLFIYSAEPGTPAAGLGGQIEEELAIERRNALGELVDEIGWAKVAARIGTEMGVLVEGDSGEQEYPCEGRSQFQAPEVDGVCLLSRKAEPGKLVRAKVVDAQGYDMFCEEIEREPRDHAKKVPGD